MNALHTALYTLLAVLFYKNLLENSFAKGNHMAHGTDRSKFAGKIENHQLLVDIVENTTVESELDCMLKCVRKTGCLSFDMTLAGEAPYLWKCYLLSSKHSKHSNLLVAREGYNHYYFEDEHSWATIYPKQVISDKTTNGVSHWRITGLEQVQGKHINWTVDASGGVNGARVELRGKAGSQFILHTPGLDPSTGNLSFELAGYPNHYVVAENTHLIIRVYEDTEEFKRKATFTRHVVPSKLGYETFVFQGLTVYNNPGISSRLECKTLSTMIPGSIYWFKIET